MIQERDTQEYTEAERRKAGGRDKAVGQSGAPWIRLASSTLLRFSASNVVPRLCSEFPCRDWSLWTQSSEAVPEVCLTPCNAGWAAASFDMLREGIMQERLSGAGSARGLALPEDWNRPWPWQDHCDRLPLTGCPLIGNIPSRAGGSGRGVREVRQACVQLGRQSDGTRACTIRCLPGAYLTGASWLSLVCTWPDTLARELKSRGDHSVRR